MSQICWGCSCMCIWILLSYDNSSGIQQAKNEYDYPYLLANPFFATHWFKLKTGSQINRDSLELHVSLNFKTVIPFSTFHKYVVSSTCNHLSVTGTVTVVIFGFVLYTFKLCLISFCILLFTHIKFRLENCPATVDTTTLQHVGIVDKTCCID